MSGRGDACAHTSCTCTNKNCPHYTAPAGQRSDTCQHQHENEDLQEDCEEEDPSYCWWRICLYIMAAVIGAASGYWWCFYRMPMDANLALCSMGATISIGRTRLVGPRHRINDPSVIISGKPAIPGDALCYEADTAEFFIRLPSPAIITGITYEHISSYDHPEKNILSAPKKFLISGLRRDCFGRYSEIFIGKFKYLDNGYPVQSMAFKNRDEERAFSEVKVAVTSNHGNPNFTCIYRIKIHGKRERVRG